MEKDKDSKDVVNYLLGSRTIHRASKIPYLLSMLLSLANAQSSDSFKSFLLYHRLQKVSKGLSTRIRFIES